MNDAEPLISRGKAWMTPIAILLPVSQADSSEFGTCHACDAESVQCNQTFLSTRRLPLRAGWWRSNELSKDLRPCFPSAACISTNAGRATLSESLCRDGHWGPFCSLCYDGYFKDALQLCTSCANVGLSLFLRLFPLLVLAAFVLASCAVWLLVRCAKAQWQRVVRCGERLKMRLRQVFGKISLRAMSVVSLPKIKVLVSMVQVTSQPRPRAQPQRQNPNTKPAPPCSHAPRRCRCKWARAPRLPSAFPSASSTFSTSSRLSTLSTCRWSALASCPTACG